MEFKFPQDWFEPPFTEFVLVSKEELSDDEWKIVFDPLVKKGVSNIEATIPSDTRFVLNIVSNTILIQISLKIFEILNVNFKAHYWPI